MLDFKKWQYEKNAAQMTEVLQQRGYTVYPVNDLAAAKAKILELIPENAVIGLGGSMTLEQMDILATLRSSTYRLIDRYQECSAEQHIRFYKDALQAEWFLTGTNAVTESGELVCTDCSGNRIAAMMFGPENVLVVAGVNKWVKDLNEAMRHIKKIAPMNALRNNHHTPCTYTGKCEDCNQPERMCNYTGIIHTGLRFKGRITVIVVADEAGL